ncbi:hypothetical protein [Methylomicrobium sp. Wu6]|uniref:hypothetical protein n=1 Tax=Methylomicrobium sp. Wu6 TaxID=3107928 RepID=UPI002DD63604|nr:hypothetical protein [Methylomicrobium sp. Wu6]MEC4747719.1 hypothetical protein [Methylomicrobium sp. Wu6]
MSEKFYLIDKEFADAFGYAKENPEIQPELNLWRATLIRAVKDAAGYDLHGVGTVETQRRLTREAQEWFYKGNTDFRKVCSLVGLDPETVRETILEFLTSPNQEARQFDQLIHAGKSGPKRKRAA